MRLKYILLEKIKNVKLKSTEMTFLLYVARFQNLKGEIIGVHHKDVCEGTGMCKQSFYTAMRGLEAKNIIKINKRNDIDWDILILDNDFSYDGAFQEGYINLQRKVFHQKKFNQMKAHEKYMLMYFLKNTHEGSGAYKIGTKKFYEKFKDEFDVSFRVIRSYLHKMRQFFSIGIIRGIYYITYKQSVFEPKVNKTIEAFEREAFVEAWCRRVKIKSPLPEQVRDTAKLVRQYQDIVLRGKGLNLSDLYEALSKGIQRMALVQQEKQPKNRKLNAAFVHKEIRKILFGFC